MLCSRCPEKAERNVKVDNVWILVCVGCALRIDAAEKHPATSHLSRREIVRGLDELDRRQRATNRAWERA